MTEKQLNVWREIYGLTAKIAGLKPWNYIREIDPLVFIDKTGKEYFFSIIGNMAGFPGIVIYNGFDNFTEARHRLYDEKKFKEEPDIFMQNAIIGIYGDYNELDKDTKKLYKDLGIKGKGNGTWLHYEAYETRYIPRKLTDKEAKAIPNLLENLYLMLEEYIVKNLQVDFDNDEALLRIYSKEQKSWIIKSVISDPPLDIANKDIEIEVKSDLHDIADLPLGKLTVDLDLRCVHNVIVNEENGREYLPYFAIAVNSKTGDVLEITHMTPEDSVVDCIFDLVAYIAEKYEKPKSIRINDNYLRGVLADFCSKTGIKLNYKSEQLKHIDKAFDMLYNPNELLNYMMDEFEDFRDFLEYDDEEDTDDYKITMTTNPKTKKKKHKKSNKVYVISVSAGTGCYRHLKLSGDCTLEELSEGILWAFDFMNDHLHAFFLNNRAWSEGGYYSQYMEDEHRFTNDYTLHEVLTEKHNFVYIFDFGDTWEFKCKVLRIEDGEFDDIEVVREVGEPPEQYADYEDDDYDDEE